VREGTAEIGGSSGTQCDVVRVLIVRGRDMVDVGREDFSL